MKISIVGAQGFIGNYLVKNLDEEFRIIALTRNVQNFQKKNVKNIAFDFSKSWDLKENIDVVIHAATQNLISGKTPNAKNFIDSNILTLINSLEYAKKVGIKLFIYLSTISVHGSFEGDVLLEDSNLNKPDIYGVSKYFGEYIAKDFSSDFKIIVVRLPGVVDKLMPTNRPWLSTIIYKLRNDFDLKIYNKNSYFNNIIDCENILYFIKHLLKLSLIDQFDVVNLASKEPIKLIEVIEFMRSTLNSKSKIINVDLNKNSFIISTNKLQNIYKFNQSTTIDILKNILK